jgi:hypothetical protein
MACVAASLVACSAPAPRPGIAGPAIAAERGQHEQARTACPLGRRLPPGEGIAIDYVDFVQFGHRNYIASTETVKATQLGPVIARVHCSLIAEENQRRAGPPVTNLTASFLKAGSALYQLRGYPARCRLAAYLHGRLQAYLAQRTVHHHAAPVPCALRHSRRLHARHQPRQ